MAAIHFSLALTILATLLQALACLLPCWMRFVSSFTKDIQIGLWIFCMDWKNCQAFAELDYTALDILPNDIKRLLKQFIIPPLILGLSEFSAFLLLGCSVIICSVSLCLKRFRARIIKVHLGINAACSFIILCGIFTMLTMGGDFRIVNALGSLLKFFNISFKSTYSYSFYLAASAACISLISSVLCCCIDESNDRKEKQKKNLPRSLSEKNSLDHESQSSSKRRNDRHQERHKKKHQINSITK